jgi:hypothetical protein
MLERLSQVEQRYQELMRLMADPDVAQDYEQVARYAKERADLQDLVSAYRVLAMFLEMKTWAGNTVDINADGANDTKDYALLTLGNGAVDLYVEQVAADNYTIWLKSGFYVSNIWGASGWAGKENPLLYCEVAQR